MGQDKALLQLAGRSLLELALDKLRILPLAAAPRTAGAPSEHAGVVADLHPGCGPLSGIEAALAASTQPLNVFSPWTCRYCRPSSCFGCCGAPRSPARWRL